MADILRVNSDELRGVSTSWNAEVFDLHAAPPALDPAGGWPTMLASAAVTGVAQAATVDLHTRITGTAEATQVSATRYDANEADAADAIKNVISTVTNAVRNNT
jgi:hypothetical protein